VSIYVKGGSRGAAPDVVNLQFFSKMSLLRIILTRLIKPLITCRGVEGGGERPLLPTELHTFTFKIFSHMPLPAILAGLGAIAGSAINSGSQSSINRQNMDFQRLMYEKQRADNLEFWNMTNAYNSPAEQMKRFQEAGLNPALMYSQGQPGLAPSLKSPDTSPPELRNPEWGNMLTGGLGMINEIADLDIKQAQTDNLQAQNTVFLQDAELRRAQTDQTRAATNRLIFDLGFDEEFRETSAEMKKEGLRQLKANIDLSLRKDYREAVALSSSVAEAADRMKTAYQTRLGMELGRAKTSAEIDSIKQEMRRVNENIKLLKQQGTLNRLEIEMRKKNMTFNDPLWSRMLAPALQKLIFGSEDIYRTSKSFQDAAEKNRSKGPVSRSLYEKLLFGF